MHDHRQIDQRSLELGRAIARHVAARPELIRRAQATLERWIVTCSASTLASLQEWKTILDGPIQGVIALLTDPSENAIRLRQSNPFAGVLPNHERNSIIKAFESHDAASA